MSKNQNYEEYQDQDDNRPLSIEEQRARLRQLIIMGKERGYITYPKLTTPCPTICPMPSKSTISSA